MPESLPHLPLFVYGTLMRGERAHHLLRPHILAAAEGFLDGAAQYSLGQYPMAVAATGRIVGEVFWLEDQVYEEALARLDSYEGPQYLRLALQITLADRHEDVLAWVYMGKGAPPAGATFIPHGDWGAWQGRQPA